MPVVVAELPTIDVSFGFEPDDIVTAGDLFNRRFVVESTDAPDCDPADFTGFTPAFDIVDSVGAVVISGTVAPPAGDTTGTFVVSLTAVQTAALVVAPATTRELAYRLRIDDGAGIIITLFCGQIRFSVCVAAA
jgi:hypothetical protein